MDVTIYDLATGKILRTIGVMRHADVDLNYDPASEAWVEGSFPASAFRVEAGAPVPLPEQPPYPATFDDATLQWVWNEAASWADRRRKRDAKLAACDWTQIPDAPLSTAEKAAWATYRQALRDLPSNTTDPRTPTWPALPA